MAKINETESIYMLLAKSTTTGANKAPITEKA